MDIEGLTAERDALRQVIDNVRALLDRDDVNDPSEYEKGRMDAWDAVRALLPTPEGDSA